MKLSAVAAAVVACCVALPSFAQSHPPVEAFGNLPFIRNPVLSPDGKHMAAVQTLNGVPVATIYQVGAPPDARPALVGSPDGIIGYVKWVKNDRLLIGEKANRRAHNDLYLRTWWRAFVVDTDGKNPALLFAGDRDAHFNTVTAFVADTNLDDPDNIFMPVLRLGHDWGEANIELDRVNVRDGSAKTFLAGDMYSVGWSMDGHGKVVTAYREYPALRSVRITIPAGENFRDVASFTTGTDARVGAVGITDDASAAVMSLANEQKRSGFFAVDLKSAKSTPLFSNPDYDIDYPIFDDWTGRVIGVSYMDEKPEFVYFDPARQHLQKLLEASFPGRSVHLASNDLVRDLYIVETDSPQEPSTYYYFDPKTKHASAIGTAYPMLPADALGVMKPMTYTARDGLIIHGYLTVPPGSSGKNIPLVVMPHGGPVERDSLRFDWWAQFLANRGYGVFQPNFRGSSGYGYDFVSAGHGEWGRKMQDDITDGVKKLIADGTVDPKRICIVGASYGGYAALAGAAFTPDLYACAVSYAGVSDLNVMLSRELKHRNEKDPIYAVLAARIGDPSDDADKIAAVSPAKHAANIKIPVLLMAASDDTTVPIEQSTMMNDAMKAANKDVRFIRIEGDDHYLDLASTRVRVLNETEKFLEANIGAGTAAAH